MPPFELSVSMPHKTPVRENDSPQIRVFGQKTPCFFPQLQVIKMLMSFNTPLLNPNNLKIYIIAWIFNQIQKNIIALWESMLDYTQRVWED